MSEWRVNGELLVASLSASRARSGKRSFDYSSWSGLGQGQW